MNVWAGIYIHRFGTTVRLFSTEEKVQEWRSHIAKDRWAEEFPDEERPDDTQIGDKYFQLMMDVSSEPDSFHIQSIELNSSEVLNYI